MQSLETDVGAQTVEQRSRVIVEIANPAAGQEPTGPWIRSYRSVDGTRVISVLDAADVATVEATYRQAGIAVERAWTTYEYEAAEEPAAQTTVVVVTDYEQPLSDDENGEIGVRVFECIAARSGAWARSYLATDRLRMVCEFQGCDTESVREALYTASVAFGVAWRANKLENR